mgnify:FL=1
MTDIRQLIKSNKEEIFPQSFVEAITERSTGKSLSDILRGFNNIFVAYTDNEENTRLQVPLTYRKQGLTLTYVNDNTVISAIYIGNTILDDDWKLSKNWKLVNTSIPYWKIENNQFKYSIDGSTWYDAGDINTNNIWLSENPPIDTTNYPIWADPSDTYILNSDTDEIKNIKTQLKELSTKIKGIEKLTTIGVVASTVADSYRRQIMSTATPEKPEDATDVDDTDDSEDKPDTSDIEPTTTHIAIKSDTAANFTKNKQDLIDSEILFYTDRKKIAIYYKGNFYVLGSSGESSGGGGLSVDELYSLEIENLLFTNGNKLYRVKVDSDGDWRVLEYNKEPISVGSPDAAWGVYINYLLCINEVFCGGNNTEGTMVSHNFIELANASNTDINLNGIHLLYTDGSQEDPSDVGYIWKVLDLQGTIKAGSTFVIRGNRCNSDKASFIKVQSYDMEWDITFNQGKSSFLLCAGDKYKELLNKKQLRNTWNKNTIIEGYIDACGFGEGASAEGTGNFLVNSDWNNTLFVRWFMLDPCKQGNKAYSARSTSALWTYIDLSKHDEYMGNSTQYYYPDYIKQLYTPRASYEKKDFFTNKNKFDNTKPNYVCVTFGIQATDNGNGATRCFNWISVGYYDEYLEYKIEGTDEWKKVYSITKNNRNNTDDINKYIDYYQRLKWTTSDGMWVTTHKCIVKGLKKGIYEYRIGRDNNSFYKSEIKTFTVKSDSDVKTFSFIQTTDQQGFNWAEYQAWKKSAYVLSNNENNFDFTINTGDITQNGNRVNEWLDYYDGRQFIDDKEEMFTIGNNDLCGHNSTELTDGNDNTSKYNHINVLRYFTFELDINNNYYFTWNEQQYPIYSMYSFNYGNYHFISLNSEIAQASSKMYKDWNTVSSGDATMANAANAAIEDWFIKDLQLYTKNDNPTNCKNCIVYMHEMPFTIVTYGFMTSTAERVGSHLNILNDKGLYRFSRLFKKYGIRLVIGGHKHTYSISKPIYDAPTGYIDNNNHINNNIDLMSELQKGDTRKPVIQVTKGEYVQSNEYARYEIVDKINAPTYVMSQATGYKLISNKEQPASDIINPWLLSYFMSTGQSNAKENLKQHYPMYIRYDLSDIDIKVTARQVQNVWNVNITNNTKTFDMNRQLTDLGVKNMTLSEISDNDMTAYNVTDKETYTIKL